MSFSRITPSGREWIDQHAFATVVVESLAGGKDVLLRVTGGSMLPWLREGRKLRIRPVNGRLLGRGDIALYRRANGRLILHRVRQAGTSPESGGLLYQCRGDAEAGAPESVPAAAVLGVVALPIGERLAFRLLDPPRRALNQLLSKLGIRVRHG